MVQIVDFKQAKEQRERERRKLDPKRQALVKQIADQHPEWARRSWRSCHDPDDCYARRGRAASPGRRHITPSGLDRPQAGACRPRSLDSA